ncbi:MAG: LytTR family transcriptional regulator [Saprospirales bacterium]|nr:MAG: LytTR family transcriptional regulator [Saprospirales bacterium]
MAFLNQPYPLFLEKSQKWKAVIFIGGFVFLFLLFFQPFGLSDLFENKIPVLLGYGLITSFVVWLFNFPFQALFPRLFSEKSWTLLKEILFSMAVITTIAIANWVYTITLGYMRYSIQGFLTALLWTFSLGVFPMTVGILFNYYFLFKKYLAEAKALRGESTLKKSDNKKPGQEGLISLFDQTGNELIRLSSDEIIRLEAAGNYVELHFSQSGETERLLIRSTLKNLLNQINGHQLIVQTHRSHAANLYHLQSVSGNAQGLQLQLNFSEEKVPVSRSFIPEVKAKINQSSEFK